MVGVGGEWVHVPFRILQHRVLPKNTILLLQTLLQMVSFYLGSIWREREERKEGEKERICLIHFLWMN